MAKPNTEQLEALQQFAHRNGRTWKSVLRQAWMTGQYPVDCDCYDSNLLQQVRNAFGPSWLMRFHLPKVAK